MTDFRLFPFDSDTLGRCGKYIGRHPYWKLYFNEIIRANTNLFAPVIPQLDKWLLGIEELRLPRNIVAHMNFPSNTDKKRIDVFYDDCLNLVALVRNKVELKIP